MPSKVASSSKPGQIRLKDFINGNEKEKNTEANDEKSYLDSDQDGV
jgi:hypothetical protein